MMVRIFVQEILLPRLAVSIRIRSSLRGIGALGMGLVEYVEDQRLHTIGTSFEGDDTSVGFIFMC